MSFMDFNFGKVQSIWADTSEQWDDIHPSWKIVGNSPKRICRTLLFRDFYNIDSKESIIDHIFSYREIYYSLVFPSGRKSFGISKYPIQPGLYAIIEADRGEDCAIVLEECVENANAVNIIRLATPKDIEILKIRRADEKRALEKCIALVKDYGYPMEITRCEFQWDMKKITFYFTSSKRIDFRELVRELFKYFKIRIWMSMENRNIT